MAGRLTSAEELLAGEVPFPHGDAPNHAMDGHACIETSMVTWGSHIIYLFIYIYIDTYIYVHIDNKDI